MPAVVEGANPLGSPASATWPYSSSPGRPAARTERASISRSRSMPVRRPIASRRNTRSSVTMLPVAPGAYGQPPRPPWDAVELANPDVERGDDVREPLAARVVKVSGAAQVADFGAQEGESAGGPASGSRSRRCRRDGWSRRRTPLTRAASPNHVVFGNGALNRAAERLSPGRPRPRSPGTARLAGRRSRGRSARISSCVLRMFAIECGSLTDTGIVSACTPASNASSA